MVKENGVVWLSTAEFVRLTDKNPSIPYGIFINENKRQTKERRTRKINGIIHIREDYLNIHEKEINEIQRMYYEIREDFESEFDMARYFAKKYNESPFAVVAVLRVFSFKKVFRKYHKWFSEYLEQKTKDKGV